MTGYSITEAELWDSIRGEKPSWETRAAEKTEASRQAGHYVDSPQIWSEIKDVYRRLQQNKCAFCERSLEGRLENDVEHFRPKQRVDAFVPRGDKYDFECGAAAAGGYYLLAYQPFNYVASCKPCNSEWKRNYFPVAGQRVLNGESPVDLFKSESPHLIYPLGDFDSDPRELITFLGPLAVPSSTDTGSSVWRRAKVTIDVLNLNRDYLVTERALCIAQFWEVLENCRQPRSKAEKKRAEGLRAELTAPNAEHASCRSCFDTLYWNDFPVAEQLFNACAPLRDKKRQGVVTKPQSPPKKPRKPNKKPKP